MRRISRAIAVLAVCGFVVESARATPVILDNPYGLSIEFINNWGIESWLYWDTDTLETAYDNGQVDVSMPFEGIAFGAATNLVNGSYDGPGLVMYDTWTARYSFNPSYDGPRTLGNDAGWGHAMRIGIDGHENANRYHLEVFYSKTAAPNTPIKLFEVQDLDPDMEWRPYCILVNTDAATQAIGNIDSLFIKSHWVDQQTGSPGGGHIKEFNASFVPGLGDDKELLFPAAPDLGWTGTSSANMDWTVGSYITIGSASISVTALGYVDLESDGLADSHSVGIYDAAQVLVASATVAAGQADPLFNGWRYAELVSPVELTAGATYLVVGDTGNGTDLFRYIPLTDTDEPIPLTGNGVEVPDLDGEGIGYAGVSAFGDLSRVYAESGGSGLAYPTVVRDGAWNAVNMQYKPVPGAATIIGESITNNMARLVIDFSGAAYAYYPKTTSNLVDGIWGSVAHSDDGLNPFYVTNLNYSTMEGGSKVIYVDASDSQRFFGIGGAE